MDFMQVKNKKKNRENILNGGEIKRTHTIKTVLSLNFKYLLIYIKWVEVCFIFINSHITKEKLN